MHSQTIAAEPKPHPMTTTFPGRDLVSIRDLSPVELESLFHLAALVKARPEEFRSALAGKHIAMFFEKPSLRTRITFEAAICGLGGSVSFIDQRHERLDAREKRQAADREDAIDHALPAQTSGQHSLSLRPAAHPERPARPRPASMGHAEVPRGPCRLPTRSSCPRRPRRASRRSPCRGSRPAP